MTTELMPIRNVSNHYGPRPLGGAEGQLGCTADNKRTFGFDGTNAGQELQTIATNLAPGTYVFSAEYGDPSTALTLAGVDISAGATVTVTESSEGFDFTGTGKTMIDCVQYMA